MRREKIGEISVDAGICWIGDPCYILHQEKGQSPKDIGKTWSEFCQRLFPLGNVSSQSWQLNHDAGHAGLGVVVSTGYGDGCYPVYAEFNPDGRVAKVYVDFIGDDEDDN